MRNIVDIQKNEILRAIWLEGKLEGYAEGYAIGYARGLARGRLEGKVEMLSLQLKMKFGRLPKWAQERVATATPAKLDRWALKVLTADTLAEVVGERYPSP